MPRIPQYQPNQVRPVAPSDARLRAADNGGGIAGAFGAGAQRLGAAVGEYVEVQDKLKLIEEDTVSRSTAIDADVSFSDVTRKYSGMLGANAREAQGAMLEELNKVRDEALKKANGNKRLARMLTERLAPLHAQALGSIKDHAFKQGVAERVGTMGAEVALASDKAVAADTIGGRSEAIGSAVKATNDLLDFQGISDPGARGFELRKVTSRIHRGILDRELSAAIPDAEMVAVYLEAHEDEMLTDDIKAIRGDLKPVMMEREAANGFAEILGTGRFGGAGNAAPAGTMIVPFAGFKPGAVSKGGSVGAPRDGGRRKHNGEDFAAPVGTAIVAPASGVIIATPQGGAGGHQVRIRTDDGTVFGFAHLSKLTAKVGATVSAGEELGLSGNTGINTSGPHVHMTVTAGGKKVSPSEFFAGKPTAVAGAGPSAAKNYDQAAVLASIDGRRDWSFEKKQLVKTYARSEMAKAEAALSDQYQDAAEQAAVYIGKAGGKITSVNALPRSIRDRMSPKALADLGQNIRAANEAAAEAKPNGSSVQELNVMRFNDPDKFMQMDLVSAYYGKVTPAEMDTARTMQAQMKAEARKPVPSWSPREGIVSALNFQKKVGGLELNTAQEGRVLADMEFEARALKKAGKDPDYDLLAQKYSRRVMTSADGNTGGLYNVKIGNIPKAKADDIRQKWKQEMGREPTDEEVLSIFRRTFRFVTAP